MRSCLCLGALLLWWVPGSVSSQQPVDTRAQIEALQFPPLRFNPPQARKVTLSNGVPVYLLEDHTLPMLSVQLVSRVGVANLPDSLWGVGWQADVLMRTGGTTRLTPDSVDKLIEFNAINIAFFTLNETSIASISGLSRHRDQMLDLAFEMMKSPRNDTSQVRTIAGQQQETWRRRNDAPGSILDRAWSQVMLGDHPLGRSLAKPHEIAGFTPQRFRWVQERIFCPDNFVIGASGDFHERDLIAKLERLFRGWGRCQPGLRELPSVTYAQGPRLVLIEKDVNQTSIRMGHVSSLRVADTPDYFAAQVANFLLGGSGLTSRMLARVRNDSGFGYNASSVWGASPKRESQFLAGAEIRAEKTVAGVSLMLRVIGSMASEPVTARDVKLAKDREVNSYVFRFEDASSIVAEQMFNAVDGLPADWSDVYLRGIEAVTPDQVRRVSERYLHPEQLVIVVIGKAAAFDRPLSDLGEVTVLPVDSIRR